MLTQILALCSIVLLLVAVRNISTNILLSRRIRAIAKRTGNGRGTAGERRDWGQYSRRWLSATETLYSPECRLTEARTTENRAGGQRTSRGKPTTARTGNER